MRRQIIIAETPYGREYYSADSEAEKAGAFALIIEQRIKLGYYEDEKDKAYGIMRDMIEGGSSDAGWAFLQERKHAEYENLWMEYLK